MFHEVRILDAKGNQKKVLSSKLLSKKYWVSFFDNASNSETAKNANIKPENKPGKKSKVSSDGHYLP